MTDYAAARLNMVDGQLRTNGITDLAVLEAFLAVPRERFVPEALRGAAYVDEDLSLGGGRYMMEPLVLARLIQLAGTQPQHRVLLVGAATGYAAAILARVAKTVVALESDPALAATARRLLAELGSTGVHVVEGPLAAGHAAGAPYDVIILGGAVSQVPDAIADQLAEGGRLAAVMLTRSGMGEAVAMTRVGHVMSRRSSFGAATPPLPGFAPAPGFVF